MNTMRYMCSVAGYSIMARNLRRGGYSCLQVADAMTRRLELDRFDVEKMGEKDRRKYEELQEFLVGLAKQ